jgi:FkbM family methyltransferase
MRSPEIKPPATPLLAGSPRGSASEAFLERHPPVRLARLLRGLRGLRRVRGWGYVVRSLIPAAAGGDFAICNGAVRFAGDLGSHVDRESYLFGQYEAESLRLFLQHVPPARRGVVLDVGANVGTHTSVFARHFAQVHSFEPNPAVWSRFERNVALNGFENVRLHRLGLADRDAELDFHAIDAPNQGLGTFSALEQYALPLKRVGRAAVMQGDEYLARAGIGSVDAIKIDVQGFEPEVLRGLRQTLERCRPIVWCEVGTGTQGGSGAGFSLRELFPYPVRLLRIEVSSRMLYWHAQLATVAGDELPVADYLVMPA